MRIYIKLVLTALFWGGTFVAGRTVSQDVAPASIAFLRFAMAAALLAVITCRLEGRLPRLKRSQFLPVVLLGLVGIFVYNIMFFKGLRLIEAGRASLIIATCPIFITIASAVFVKEKITISHAAGIILSVCGAVVVISRGSIRTAFEGGLGRGELYIFCCVLSWVAYSLIGKTVMRDMSPLAAVSYSAIVGAVTLAVPAMREGLAMSILQISPVNWLSIAYLAIFGTVIGFVWYYQAVRTLGPTRAGLFINFVPVFAILSAFLIIREPITLSLIAGGALVIVGAYITNRSHARA